MTDDLIDRAKKALEGATRGHWQKSGDATVCVGQRDIAYLARNTMATAELLANVSLIALAPDLARALIRERKRSERLEDALRDCEAWLRRWH